MLESVFKNRLAFLKLNRKERKNHIVERMIPEGDAVTNPLKKRYRQMLDRVLRGEVEDPHFSVVVKIVEAMGGRIVISWDEQGDFPVVETDYSS